MKQQPLIRPIFFVFILFAFLNIGSAQTGITYEFDDHFNITSDGVSFPLPFKGEANLYAPNKENTTLSFKGNLDLIPLDKKLTKIIGQQVNGHDKIGGQLEVKNARFITIRKGKIRLKVDLRYDNFFKQNGNIVIEIIPKIKPRGVEFLLEVVKVDADGVLGTLMEHSSYVRKEITKAIAEKLPDSLGTSLTEEFKELEILEVRQVEFAPGPSLRVEVFAKDDVDTILDYILKYKK